MRRSKKIQTRKGRKTRTQKLRSKTYRRKTRQCGGRNSGARPAGNIQREELLASILQNTTGLQAQPPNNGNNNNYNNNNYNNNNYNQNEEEEASGLNLIYIKDLYDTIDSIDNEEEKKRIVKAVGGWLYAVFVTGPKKNPGDTKESMIESVQYETQKYLGYTLNAEDPDFDHVMYQLHNVYERIKSLDDESFAYSNMQEHYEEFQEEYEKELGL
jgi:hypothetical protein